MLEPPWRDPKTDPPEEYTEVIVTTETGRVTSSYYYKGRFNTYTPIIAWQPMPKPARIKKEAPAKPPSEGKNKGKQKGKDAVARKTKV